MINSDFSLQGAQAGGEYPVVHCTTGLAKTHRLLAQIALRWRQTRPCKEEESEEGKWRCRTGRGRRL